MAISWLHALNAVAFVGCCSSWVFLQAKYRKTTQERHMLESAFNQGTPVCITGANYEIIKANEAYWSVFGRPQDPEQPVKCFEHRPGKACHTDNCPLTRILSGQKIYTCEPQKEHNGEIHFFTVVAQPFYGNGRHKGEIRGVVEMFYDITEKKRLEEERIKNIADLEESLKRVKLLSGLIPICAACKKVRDDQGYWSQVESYIASHSEAMFSHGICPDCIRKFYPKVFSEMFPHGLLSTETTEDDRPDLHLVRDRGGLAELALMDLLSAGQAGKERGAESVT